MVNIIFENWLNCIDKSEEGLRKFFKIEAEKWKSRKGRQAWNAVSGKAYEMILVELFKKVLPDEICVVRGAEIIKILSKDDVLFIKKQLTVPSSLGDLYPDDDIIFYEKETLKVVALVLAKTSFHGRLTETTYWFTKLGKVPFVKIMATTDLIDELSIVKRDKLTKARRIALIEVDCLILTRETYTPDKKIIKIRDIKL